MFVNFTQFQSDRTGQKRTYLDHRNVHKKTPNYGVYGQDSHGSSQRGPSYRYWQELTDGHGTLNNLFQCGRLGRLQWEKNLQGLKSWAWPPKFCRTFGVLQNLSSTGFLLCETFCRTFLQNPKGSAEIWGTFGAPARLFRPCEFFSHPVGNLHPSPNGKKPLCKFEP